MSNILIGIIAAVDPEIEAVKQEMKNPNCRRIFELEFWSGLIGGEQCVCVKSGVGKVNAARAAQIMIDNYSNLKYMFNVGTAGGLDICQKAGDLIISESLVQVDYDRSALGNAPAHIPNLKSAYIASDPKLLDICRQTIDKMKDYPHNIYSGIIATADIFKLSAEKRDEIINLHKALCFEMEGAAIAHVCELCQIPFVAVRSVTNFLSGQASDEEEFWKYRKYASECCARFIQHFCILLSENPQ